VTVPFSPAQQIVIDAVNHALGREPFGASLAGDEPVDWDDVLAIALREGLAALVHAGMASCCASVPEVSRTRLKVGYLGAVTWFDACLEPSLQTVLRTLHSLGIEPIVLKGAALAYTVYPRPYLRTMGDVDLLLSEEEAVRAAEGLKGAGFFSVDNEAGVGHHLPPRRAARWRLRIELHHHLLPRRNPYAIDLHGFRRRSRADSVAGVETQVPAPVDALHLACLHLSYSHRYRWFLLRGLTDIVAITTRWASELDWDFFLALTRASRTHGAAYWPLWLCRDWMGAKVPEQVLSRLAPMAPIRRLISAAASPQYILGSRQSPETANDLVRDLLLDLSLHQGCSAIDQTKALVRGLFPPPEALGHLPAELSRSRLRYSAYLIRPDRMIRGAIALGRLLAKAA